MQSADDESPDQRERAATSRRVQERISEMHDHRAVVLRARQAGTPTQRQQLQFQTRVVELAEELRPFRDETAQWEQAGPERYTQHLPDPMLDRLPELTRSRQRTETETVGFGRLKSVTREEPGLLPTWVLLDLSHDLDDIASDIGFEVAPDTPAEERHGGTI